MREHEAGEDYGAGKHADDAFDFHAELFDL
jgi:hypothetical protein